jgi:hypothetical protein
LTPEKTQVLNETPASSFLSLYSFQIYSVKFLERAESVLPGGNKVLKSFNSSAELNFPILA